MKERIVFLLLLSLGVYSCETVVQLDLDEGEKKLVTEATLFFTDTADVGSVRVKLSESGAYFSNVENLPVSDAVIVLNNQYLLTENLDSAGFYTYEGIPNSLTGVCKLEIQADVDGLTSNWVAEDSICSRPQIDSIYSIFKEPTFPAFEEGYVVKIQFTDPYDEVNYYHMEVLESDTSAFELNPGTKRSIIFTDELFNGMELNFEVNERPFQAGDSVDVIISGITKDVYDYYYNLYTLLTETSGIGAAPPFPLNGNVIDLTDVENNALGYFQVRNKAIRSIVIVDDQ